MQQASPALRTTICAAFLTILLIGCGGGNDSPSDAEIPPPPSKNELRPMQTSGDASANK